MNQRLILIGLLYAVALSANIYCQNKTEKFTHPLVDTIAYRNEFSINLAPFISLVTAGRTIPSTFVASLGYSHNFGRNNYLRAGVKVMPISLPLSGNDEQENTFYHSYTYFKGSADQLPSFNDTAAISSLSTYKVKTSFYIGYEHLFGRSRTRFLLGIDMYAGFTYHYIRNFVNLYPTVYTRDSVSGEYAADVAGFNSFDQNISVSFFHWGLSPRVGIRFEASKRIALTAVLCPMLYMELGGFYFDSGTHKYVQTSFNSLIDVQPFVGEIGLQVKM